VLELDWITIRGFKSIASIEQLCLRPINIVIGANGSGKSNFIGVFSFLHEIREGRLYDYVAKGGGAEKVLHFGSKNTSTLHLHVSFKDGVNQYELELQPTRADELTPTRELAYYWNKSQYPEGTVGYGISWSAREAGISDPKETSQPTQYVRRHFDRWRVFHFQDTGSSSPMKKLADIADNQFFRPDGSNLASFLYYLREKQPSSFNLIRSAVQRVAPFFDDFQLEPSKLNPDRIRLEWRHKRSDAYFDAASLSDGTLRFLALATLFLQPESLRPSVILVDEPELGLHPFAITMLASLIKQASLKTQVVISTQSPFLLDHFEPDDVLVADRVDGGTKLTRPNADNLAGLA
jgi:predicted ATPase